MEPLFVMEFYPVYGFSLALHVYGNPRYGQHDPFRWEAFIRRTSRDGRHPWITIERVEQMCLATGWDAKWKYGQSVCTGQFLRREFDEVKREADREWWAEEWKRLRKARRRAV